MRRWHTWHSHCSSHLRHTHAHAVHWRPYTSHSHPAHRHSHHGVRIHSTPSPSHTHRSAPHAAHHPAAILEATVGRHATHGSSLKPTHGISLEASRHRLLLEPPTVVPGHVVHAAAAVVAPTAITAIRVVHIISNLCWRHAVHASCAVKPTRR